MKGLAEAIESVLCTTSAREPWPELPLQMWEAGVVTKIRKAFLLIPFERYDKDVQEWGAMMRRAIFEHEQLQKQYERALKDAGKTDRLLASQLHAKFRTIRNIGRDVWIAVSPGMEGLYDNILGT